MNIRSVIVILVFIGVLAAGIYFGVMPALQSVNQSIADLKQVSTEFRTKQAKLDSLTKLSESSDNLKNAQAAVAAAIPNTLEQDRLTLMIEQLAADQKVALASLAVTSSTTAKATPTPVASASPSATATPSAVTSSSLKTATVAVNVKGTYDTVKNFVTAFENLDRIISVTSFTFTNTVGKDEITADLKASAYGWSDKAN